MRIINHFRIRNLPYILGLLLVLNSCNSDEDDARFYHPAEFEKSESICFVWSEDYYTYIPRLISTLSKKDHVTIFAGSNAPDREHMLSVLEQYDATAENLRFMEMNILLDNVWIRDYGPVFLINGRGDKELVRFQYFWSDPGFIEAYSAVTGYPVIQSPLQSTGGSREVNGKGTMILCEAHENAVNQGISIQEIENELITKLKQKKIIWLKQGIPQDDNFRTGPIYDEIYPKGVNGHVDEFCRFADPNTILITSVSEQDAGRHPILAEARRRMESNIEILQNSTDQDGKPIKVVRVPIAPLIISDRRQGPEGQLVTSVTSYMNFIISNSMIILPSYVSETEEKPDLQEKEKEVVGIFERIFPDREIVRMRSDTLNYYSGGFHCISIHEPMTPLTKDDISSR